MHDLIYRRPDDYDLEHENDDEDVRFWVELTRRAQPSHVVELGAGSGRVTLPLATLAAREGFELTAIDLEPTMLDAAREKLAATPAAVRDRVHFVEADMRSWRLPHPVDLVLIPCASISHLLTLDDQLAAWRAAADNLAPDGRFAVDSPMPNLATFGDSLQQPPRALVEIDSDTTDAQGRRLVRHRTTVYAPDQQQAEIRFIYDKFTPDAPVERWLSDFASHVYFPRELQLLFHATGFVVEALYGDYRFRTFGPRSPEMIVVGRRQTGR